MHLLWASLITAAFAADPPADSPTPEGDASAPPAPAPKAPHEGRSFTFVLHGGGAAVRERETGAAPAGLVDVGARYLLPAELQLGARIITATNQQSYVSSNPNVDGGGLQRVEVAEVTTDATLGVGWNALPLLSDTSKASARVGLDLRFLSMSNAVFPHWMFGPRIDASVRIKPVEGFRFDASGGVTPRIASDTATGSALGLPMILFDAEIGSAVEFGEGAWALEFAWRFDEVGFEHTTRSRHAALGGVSLSF